ncbi:MAG: hypothetical protein Satyrvirus17_13 [Satyrvirus sp.]|uniref:Uncharacterized protein n=1 Tax=Satyrvirus sp. TaxID=2487771 RepID=A0A3G5AI36_9VIRU|nr:MAG: hypothetical protein Satyrvirus17_13 [Satyrvirus sp.]
MTNSDQKLYKFIFGTEDIYFIMRFVFGSVIFAPLFMLCYCLVFKHDFDIMTFVNLAILSGIILMYLYLFVPMFLVMGIFGYFGYTYNYYE